MGPCIWLWLRRPYLFVRCRIWAFECVAMGSCKLLHIQIRSSAAEDGQLKGLQWARAHGCDWDCNMTFYAAVNEHLNALQWACPSGCE